MVGMRARNMHTVVMPTTLEIINASALCGTDLCAPYRLELVDLLAAVRYGCRNADDREGGDSSRLAIATERCTACRDTSSHKPAAHASKSSAAIQVPSAPVQTAAR